MAGAARSSPVSHGNEPAPELPLGGKHPCPPSPGSREPNFSGGAEVERRAERVRGLERDGRGEARAEEVRVVPCARAAIGKERAPRD